MRVSTCGCLVFCVVPLQSAVGIRCYYQCGLTTIANDIVGHMYVQSQRCQPFNVANGGLVTVCRQPWVQPRGVSTSAACDRSIAPTLNRMARARAC